MQVLFTAVLLAIVAMLSAGLTASEKTRSPKFFALNTICFFLIAWLISYFALPSLSLSEWPIYVAVLFFTGAGIIQVMLFESSTSKQRYSNTKSIDKALFIYGLIITFALLGFIISSTSLFRSDDFHNRLELTETEVFDASSTLIDAQQGRYVDGQLAFKTAQTMLSKRLGLGSRYKFDSLRIQSVDGQLYWVAPLVNKSLIKWFNNAESPGYVMVSATDINDATLVLDKFPIKYGNEGFYGFDNIERHLYASGYSTVRFGTSALELRDGDLKPFWIVPILTSKIGVVGLDVKSIVVIDASSGELKEYEPVQAPDWIDRIIPQDIFADQVDDWGAFVEGWFNAKFIGDNVIRATPGTLFTYTSDGRGVWYTGVQSDGSSQEGTMGFVMGNSRTGEAVFYRRQGLTESVARTVMEGAVQEAGYNASNPQPYNVNGVTTYVSILKDSNGNRQGYGMVAYNNRDIFATGKTPESARRAFLNKLLSNQSGSDLAQAAGKQITLLATVARIAIMSDSILFLVNSEDGVESTIFSIPRETNFEAPLTQASDKVLLKYSPVNTSPQPVTCFDNLAIGSDLCD